MSQGLLYHDFGIFGYEHCFEERAFVLFSLSNDSDVE
jgi:hypothetical protein